MPTETSPISGANDSGPDGRQADPWPITGGKVWDIMTDLTFTYGETPQDTIRAQCAAQCPDGYRMAVHSGEDLDALAAATQPVIDSHLEAVIFTEGPSDSAGRRVFTFTAEGLAVLCRRLSEAPWGDPDASEDPAAHGLRSCILETLGIEEI